MSWIESIGDRWAEGGGVGDGASGSQRRAVAPIQTQKAVLCFSM